MLNSPGKLLPDELKSLWDPANREGATDDQLWRSQERLMDAYRTVWADALRLSGYTTLRESLLAEVGEYIGLSDTAEIERRCREAVSAVKAEWHEKDTRPTDRQAVEAFYDASEAYIFDLMWWHTLVDDPSPLAYVIALRFAGQQSAFRYLDFGAGVGSAGIVATRHGFDVTLADISTNLLGFARWRFRRRGLSAQLIDLKNETLPSGAFQMVTAMDVWEHLVDPVGAVDTLADAITPGGYLYGRFAAQPDPDYPQHIVTDFQATFERLAARGFVEVWRDDWLWGHQLFQKRA